MAKSEGCWNWTASTFRDGYGQFQCPLGTRAHRVSWALEYGEIPTLQVLHRCDNPRCVRPSHLFLGTNADNLADRQAKGRQAQGERQWKAKLTDREVSAIRQLYAIGFTQLELVAMYNSSRATVNKLVNGKVRRNLQEVF